MKIAFIGDKSGKVHFNRFLCLSERIHDHSFVYFPSNSIDKINVSSFDCVYYSSLTLFLKYPVKHPYILGSITSWKCLTDKDSFRIFGKINKFIKVSVNNLNLYKSILKYRNDILYIPNGVDTNTFFPEDICKTRFSIGWVGNIDRKEKRYKEFLVPIQRVFPKQFDIIGTKKGSAFNFNHTEMRKYYNGVKFFLVTSSHEGTPNPALEAASCGVPVVSTPVGNMTELIKNGENGFITEHSVENIVDVLKKCSSMNESDYLSMSKSIRHDILNGWSWDVSAKKFKDFFEYVK